MRGDGYQLGRRPELDGLRAVAVLFVMVYHANILPVPSGGAQGVTLFFVLSGFLITRLLVEERQRTGRIHYRAFYLRRARRLLPALATLLAVTTIILAAKGMPLLPQLTAALYISNIAGAAGLPLNLVGHTWTLSLEEQFYLIWPPLLVLTARTKRVPMILAALIGVSVIIRLLTWQTTGNWARVWYGPDTRADAVLIGCLLGLTVQRTGGWRGWPPLAGISALVLLGCLGFPSRGFVVWLLLPMALASAAIISWAATCTDAGLVRRALTARPMRYLGRISYGLYLWHYPIMYVAFTINPHHLWAMAALTFPLSILIAAASWRLIEQPFLRNRANRPSRSGPCGSPDLHRESLSAQSRR